jgi:hypothetical protein
MKDAFFVVLKFLFAVLILPLVIASTFAFQNELVKFEPALRDALSWGMFSYIILKFFVYDFGIVYAFGQRLVTAAFQFLKPLVNAAPYVFPVYSMLVLAVYAVMSWMGGLDTWRTVFLFLFSFTFSMHIILTAQDLYNKDSSAGKPTYFFGMSLVYILDVFLMALLASLVLPGFSFPTFFNDLTGASGNIYKVVIGQLFKA